MKIGILSDIHGNNYALEQVLKSATQNKVEKLLVLGDLVGYYYNPEDVLNQLASWDYELIRGNHEHFLKMVINNEISLESLNEKYGNGHKIALEKLNQEQIDMLVNLPFTKRITLNSIKFLMCHGSNWDPNYYLYPDSEKNELKKTNDPNADFVLVGHSHYPFIHRNPNCELINSGSVGQSRSRGGLAEWAIVNTSNCCVELKSTPYNIEKLIDEVKLYDADKPYHYKVLTRENK